MPLLPSLLAIFFVPFAMHVAFSAYSIFWRGEFERHWGPMGTFHFALVLAASMSFVMLASYAVSGHLSERHAGPWRSALIGAAAWCLAVAFTTGLGEGALYRQYWWGAWLLMASVPGALLSVAGTRRSQVAEA